MMYITSLALQKAYAQVKPQHTKPLQVWEWMLLL